MRAAALCLLGAGFGLTLWLDPWADQRVNDLFVYRQLAEPVLDGALPYRDVLLEYPPLAAPAIVLPGLFGTGEEEFRLAFAGWTLLLAAAVVALCGALAHVTGGDRRRALLAAAAAPLLCGAMIRTHFDLAPVALALAALALLCRDRPRAGLAVLGLAVMTKGFPIAAAPVALSWVAARRGPREALEAAAALIVVVLALSAAAVALSPGGALGAVRYQVERPVQVESVPAFALRGLDALGLGVAEPVKSHRSDGLEHPAAAAVAVAFGALLLAAIALLGRAAHRRPDARTLVLASLAAVAAFAALGKVLSPQFLIWTVPLAALAFAWRMRALAAVLAAATALTLVYFPSRYFDLVDGEPFPLAVAGARDLLLLAALALSGSALRRQEQLLDRLRPAVAPRLDQHRVEPRVLV